MITKTMLRGTAMPRPRPGRSAFTALPCTDNRLLALVQADDRSAFTEIYRCYAKKLMRYLHHLEKAMPVKEEIVQDIFLWLWLRRHSLHQVSSLQAYLFQAARFRFFNHLRTEKVKREFAARHRHTRTLQDNSLLEWINLSHLQAAIDQSIRQLPCKCQAVFRLSREHHISISDISVQMNISPRTVENYITRPPPPPLHPPPTPKTSIKKYELRIRGLNKSHRREHQITPTTYT